MMLGVSGAPRQAMTASGLSGTKRANTITPRAESRRNRWIRGARLRQNALFQVRSSGQYWRRDPADRARPLNIGQNAFFQARRSANTATRSDRSRPAWRAAAAQT